MAPFCEYYKAMNPCLARKGDGMTFTVLTTLVVALVLHTALPQTFTDLETPGTETQTIKTSGNYVVRMPSITNHPDTNYPRVWFDCSFKGNDSGGFSLNIDNASRLSG